MDFPFSIPDGVTHNLQRYNDRNFLALVLPSLIACNPVHGTSDIINLFSDFVSTHTAALLYTDRDDSNRWSVCNYAYESFDFSFKDSCFVGNCYHVTGYDGTHSNGDFVPFLSFKPRVGATVIPYATRDIITGFVIASEINSRKGSYMVNLIVGNNHLPSHAIMPSFSRDPISLPALCFSR